MPETRYPPEKLAKYPHMFPKDIAIWERFIERVGNLYDSFSYDVKVGLGRPMDPSWNENIKRMNYLLSTLRIDAVGFQPSGITIFEVKPSAGPSAIGQVLCYGKLYERDKKPTLPLRLGIVTDQTTADLNYLFDVFNIELYVM